MSVNSVFTAMDFPTGDTGVYDLGRCRLCTVQHEDCGLSWYRVYLTLALQRCWILLTVAPSLLRRSGYPSAQPPPTKKVRKRKKHTTATPASESAAPQDSASLEEALQWEEWGLPAAFGTSKASCCRRPAWIQQTWLHDGSHKACSCALTHLLAG